LTDGAGGFLPGVPLGCFLSVTGPTSTKPASVSAVKPCQRAIRNTYGAY